MKIAPNVTCITMRFLHLVLFAVCVYALSGSIGRYFDVKRCWYWRYFTLVMVSLNVSNGVFHLMLVIVSHLVSNDVSNVACHVIVVRNGVCHLVLGT